MSDCFSCLVAVLQPLPVVRIRREPLFRRCNINPAAYNWRVTPGQSDMQLSYDCHGTARVGHILISATDSRFSKGEIISRADRSVEILLTVEICSTSTFFISCSCRFVNCRNRETVIFYDEDVACWAETVCVFTFLPCYFIKQARK